MAGNARRGWPAGIGGGPLWTTGALVGVLRPPRERGGTGVVSDRHNAVFSDGNLSYV